MHRQTRWWILVLLVILLAVVPFSAAQDSSGTEIRAIWSVDTFVLLNNSDSGADVSALSFVNEVGEITPDDWVLDIDPDTGATYTLTDMRPGSCLLAYFIGTEPLIPETVSCTRVIGEFIIDSFDDIVWSIPQGGFTAEVDGSPVADCSIDRTSCDISVPAGVEAAEDGETVPETQDIRAVWNSDTLVLINNAAFGVDLSSLSLVSDEGAVLPENWVLFEDEEADGAFFTLDDVRPGSCLLVYLAETEPVLPEEVDCTRTIAEFTPLNVQDIVWDPTQGGFVPVVDGEAGADCDVTGTSCDFTVPTAEADLALNEDAEADDEEEAATDPGLVGGTSMRAIWTPDLLVLINNGDQGADISELTLTSELGRLTPDAWLLLEDGEGGFFDLNDVRPGSCLLAYPEGEQPAIPETVTCTRVIAEAELADIRDVVWDVAQGGFEARIGDALSAACAVEGTTSCDLVVPPADG